MSCGAADSVAKDGNVGSHSSVVVTVPDLGDVRGRIIGDVARFLAVPYASAPVGDLRWRPPKPPTPWEGIREDPYRLPRCPQLGPRLRTYKGHILEDAEDCLVLNIWTPLAALPPGQDAGKEETRPVLVYIHGGSGKFNSAHSTAESGLSLAKRHGLVCININYRLAVFGFLAHPELSAEDEIAHKGNREVAGSGNYAILDQIAALRWVQRYVSRFGGDPHRVTIWGLSSGSQYVSTLLVSPLARGLFHRAVLQSCVDLSNVRKLQSSTDIWLKSAEDWGCDLGEVMGCAKGEGQLAAMRSCSASDVARHSEAEAATDCYEATIDSRGLSSCRPASSLEALCSGDYHRVPVILGFTAHDGLGAMELEHTIFENTNVTDEQGLQALFQREFDTKSAEALSLYRKEQCVAGARDVKRVLADFSRDLWYCAGALHMTELLVRAGESCPVFLYCFSGLPRSLHGIDSTFWRGTEPTRLAEIMSAYLAAFVSTGDPNGDGLPTWEPQIHAQAGSRYLDLGHDVVMKDFQQDFRERSVFLAREYFGRRLIAQLRCEERVRAQAENNGSAEKCEAASVEPLQKRSRLS